MIADNPKVAPLLTLGEPNGKPWPNYIEQYGLGHDDVPALIDLLTDESFNEFDHDQIEVWAPLHAWRCLGQLESRQAIMPLIQSMRFLHDDDSALCEISKVFALIGPAAIDALEERWRQPAESEYIHVMVMDALAEIALAHAGSRTRVTDIFQAYMIKPNTAAKGLNGCLIGQLIELRATELIEDIRHLFSLECVDLFCVGDLEDVEIALGFRSERATPRPNLFFGKTITPDLDDDWDAPYDAFAPQQPLVRLAPKIGRNDPCTCGSGKKYKKCCGSN